MKKYLSIIIVFIILSYISGCTNKAETSGGNNIVKTDDKRSNTGTSIWPTKEWSTSTPEEQGLDSKMLINADKTIKDKYPNVYSLLVVRHGYLVYEKYYNRMKENRANPVYSVTKSVMSALTGIALREKLFNSVDQKISELLSEYFKQIDDTKKNEITIKNLLTMTGGLESIDTDYGSYFASRDWLSYTIDKPLTDNPGDKMVYNTGLPHFLSAAITKTSQMTTKDFANQYLASQIGISLDKWECDPKGYYVGGTNLSMTPVDMAKFGYLYLKKGLWDGKQIIPKEWIEASTQKQITVDKVQDYGYLFWLRTIKDKVHNKDYFTYRADGYGGQIIIVIPDLDMVSVITANSDQTFNEKQPTIDIIADYIIPAVK